MCLYNGIAMTTARSERVASTWLRKHADSIGEFLNSSRGISGIRQTWLRFLEAKTGFQWSMLPPQATAQGVDINFTGRGIKATITILRPGIKPVYEGILSFRRGSQVIAQTPRFVTAASPFDLLNKPQTLAPPSVIKNLKGSAAQSFQEEKEKIQRALAQTEQAAAALRLMASLAASLDPATTAEEMLDLIDPENIEIIRYGSRALDLSANQLDRIRMTLLSATQ